MRQSLRRILSSIICASTLTNIAVAGPEPCDLGYAFIKKAEYEESIKPLQQCLDALFELPGEKSRALTWTYYFLSVAYYSIENYYKASENAQSAMTVNSTNLVLEKKELDFINHVLNDLKPKYRTDLQSVISIEFAMSAKDGCGGYSHDLAKMAAIDELARCQEGDDRITSIPDWYDVGNSRSDYEANCEMVLSKYKGCMVLYCVNGRYYTKIPDDTLLRGGMSANRITCDKDEIAFYSAPEEEQEAAIYDALEGPYDYELDDKERMEPSTLIEPSFDMLVTP